MTRASLRPSWSLFKNAGVLAATLVAGLSATPAAGARDAAELIKEGVALRRQGNDVQALRKFQEALEIDKSARVVAQIGLAEQALGRWVASFEHLTAALEARTDPWIVKNRAAIVSSLSMVNDHVGRVEILGGAPGAEVRLDGVVRGTLPLKEALATTTGTITIEISAPGFLPVQRTSLVRARQTVRESFEALVPVVDRGPPAQAVRAVPGAGVAGTGAPVPAGIPPAIAAAPTPELAGAPRANTESPDSGRDGGPSTARGAAKWVAWGLGAASAGVGLYGFFSQNQAADDFAGGCGLDPWGNIQMSPGSTRSLDSCRSLKGTVDLGYRLEVIGFVGAAVLAGTGLVLWLTEPRASETGPTTVACVPAALPESGLAVGCALRL
jgi:hypothetical protein